MTILTIPLSSLTARLLRTVVIVVTFALAIGLLTVTLSALRRMHIKDYDTPDVVVVPTIGEIQPLARANDIRRVIKEGDAVDWFRLSMANDGRDYHFWMMEASPHVFERFPRSFFRVDPDVAEAWRKDRQGVIVSAPVYGRMGWQVGQQITLHTEIGDIPAHIVGFSKGFISDQVVLHQEYVDQSRPEEARGNTWLFFVHTDRSRMETLATDIRSRFQDSATPVLAVSHRNFFESGLTEESAIPDLLTRIGMLMIIVTVTIAGSTLSMSLRERRGDFAVLRAIGFTRGRIGRMILAESVLVCAMGGVLGAVTPWLFFRKNGLSLGTLLFANVTIDGVTCFIGIAVSVLLGILIAMLPAIRASRQEVAMVLREQA